MKKRIALLTALALPAVAGAATLTIVPDKLTYLPGETVTLTIFGDDEGAQSTTYSLVGRLLYDPAQMDPGSVGIQLVAGPQWISQPLTQGDGFVDVFAQAVFDLPLPPEHAPNYPAVINTVTLVMGNTLGPVSVSWAASLEFFGLTSAPGITLNVPEPGTAALLVLGLLALGMCRGRESSSCER